ncbi:MAG: glycosyltransferase, partial [Magnetococcus sp. YQC-5]
MRGSEGGEATPPDSCSIFAEPAHRFVREVGSQVSICRVLTFRGLEMRGDGVLMQDFVEALYRMDADADSVGIYELLKSIRYDASQIFHVCQHMLIHKRLMAAYILALLLKSAGMRHAVIGLALCAGGMVYGKPAEEQGGLEMLREQTDSQSVEQQRFMDETVISPVIVHLLNIALPLPNRDHLILRIIEILKAMAPPFRTIFDWDAPVPALSLEEMRKRGREEAHLLPILLPPPGAPRLQKRVLIMIAQQHGNGYSFASAMNNYGWQAEVCGRNLSAATAQDDCRAIIDMCRSKKIDILMLDANQIGGYNRQIGWDAYKQMRNQMREEMPLLKVLGVVFDSNDTIERAILEEMWDLYDGLLSHLHDPLAPHILSNPWYAKKIKHMLFCPMDDRNICKPDKKFIPNLYFRGTICAGHWPRLLWLSVADHVGINVKKDINTFSYNSELYKNSPLDDYAAYRRRVAESTCFFGIVMLEGQKRYLNSRCFEGNLSGALVVQEYSPITRNYFIAGEHYLEYYTISDLLSIVRFINEHPEEVAEIRLRGHTFACDRYSDEKIVGQIDKFLFFP